MSERRPEDEYFIRLDSEKIKALREKLDREREKLRREMEKKIHWMRCPKCGGQLNEKLFRGVMIDVCQDCEGVWLDRGELEILAGTESGFVVSLLAMLRREKR